MKPISLVFLISTLAINVSQATGDEKVDLWNRKDVVPDSCRKWLPEVSKTTGLTRVWARTDMFGFDLSDKGVQVIKSTKPSSVYRTRLSKTKMILGKRSGPKWKTYEVRRYGKLLVASKNTKMLDFRRNIMFLGLSERLLTLVDGQIIWNRNPKYGMIYIVACRSNDYGVKWQIPV